MKLYFPDQASAQAWSDAMHSTKLQATSPAYADSVAKGLTKRWCFPMQDMVGAAPGTAGVPASTNWYIVSDNRTDPCLTAPERAALLPDTAVITVPVQAVAA